MMKKMPPRRPRRTVSTPAKASPRGRGARAPAPPPGTSLADKPGKRGGKGRPAPEGTIAGVGLATVDLLCVAPRFDERKLELSVFSMQGGGSAGNALASLAML